MAGSGHATMADMQDGAGVKNSLAEGRAALRAGDWSDAAAAFDSALEAGAEAEAEEGLGWVAWYRDDGDTAMASWERAYALYRERDDAASAARAALWLAVCALEFRGQPAVAEGWFGRAERLLAGVAPSPEHGWLALHRAAIALEGEGDTSTGRSVGHEVSALARQLGESDLELVAAAMEGLGLVFDGNLLAGTRLLDEAATAAVSGELSEPVFAGWACCYVIYACEAVRDHERAAQWCEEVKRLAQRISVPYLFRVCRCHYGGVLMGFGAWAEAEVELREPIEQLSITRPGQAVEGVARLGELRRRQGQYAEATRLFAEAEGHPIALVGEAALALDRGDTSTATAALERALRRVPAGNCTARVGPLEVLVEARLATGDRAGATSAAGELAQLAERCATPHLRAVAACARGLVANEEGHCAEARVAFEDAVDLFRQARSPYEGARARVSLARVLHRLGEQGSAQKEARAAVAEAERLGARGVWSEAKAVVARVSDSAQTADRDPLTPREREVLTLVADGLSDAEIAQRLHLSPHTVHRHVANIRTKLGVASRAAAVARARSALHVPGDQTAN